MNEKSLHTLEFDKIRAMLAAHASCEKAKARCLCLAPQSDLREIGGLLANTGDALSRLCKASSPNFSGIHDPKEMLRRLGIGGSLNTAELLSIASLLEAAKRAKNYDRTGRDEEAPADSLTHLFAQLEPLSPLCGEIRRCILEEDEIADDASPELFSIRRSIRGMNERIHSKLSGLLASASAGGYLTDSVVTMRDGRYCLPVRSDAKSSVPGMVHDQSGSGSTLFIEPLAIVNLNNELRELYLKEQGEIDAILKKLSEQVAGYAVALTTDCEVLEELDFIFAKAALALEMNAVIPVFNESGKINLRKARHPLLDKETVVPIDVVLGDGFSQLIVTGPNTGGKTVSLKTVGLLALMGQAGLFIPAGDRSELALFDEVFADIGDEQSIEQSLSTFSSHMTNIVKILSAADGRTLCLFDELCAGTDPTEGAALAISILNELRLRGATVMATTHYSELKVYALSTDGVENASCEFSVETLSPTYRLLIGIPGKSNAFAISKKLGLPENIIGDARQRLSEQDINFEEMIANLEQSRKTIERDQESIRQDKAEIENLKDQLSKKQETLEKSRDDILREANEKAYQIIREAKDVADETIRNFNKYASSQPEISKMEKERAKLRDEMTKKEKKISIKKEEKRAHEVPKNLRIGDSVHVLSMNLNGTVHTLPNSKGELYVQMGILRSLVKLDDLELIPEEAPSAKKYNSGAAGKVKVQKSATVSPEINLIGKTVDEAIPLLDKYLDDAYLAHLPSVRIVHGKGTGALRNAVQSHLKRQNYIDSFRLGEMGEGDAGVTIATFK
ncbi:MAG: endonuclease MutS2 [Clostridiales bacterium]|nr:endonuclease MutS2 [Clostridiales bacterium]